MGEINNYNKKLFETSHLTEQEIENILKHNHKTLSEDSKAYLNRPFSKEEIKKIAFEIGKLKVPGPDGFQAGFYREYWDIVGDDTMDAIFEILNNNIETEDINNTFITLISKVNNAENIIQYRPISLCNVFYKILSKTLANIIKNIIDDLISQNQGAFIRNRNITENIIITHEILRFMRLNKNEEYQMTIKIDMSKAYDRVK